jgi:spore photoproduct lyase
MRVYKKESERLKSVESLVKSNFPHFGVNKKQEVTRLLYEIAKRESIPPVEALTGAAASNYDTLKKYLLERRYPDTFFRQNNVRPYLSKIELERSAVVDLRKRKFHPEWVFIEKSGADSFLVKRFKELYPDARFCQIHSLKDYRSRHRGFQVKDYNKRQDTVFIVNEGYDFFKRCPCTTGALGCGYHVFNLGFGCVFECTYCFLQEYTNSPGLVLPANIEGFFDKFNLYKKAGMRIGTGEFSDSLALDDATEYSVPLIEFFSKQKGVVFEFKTKSTGIKNILKSRHAGNIVVSWSLNPQRIIDANEYFTPSFKERLEAAAQCVEAGYKVGFHFDPVIYYKGWEYEYRALIDQLCGAIKPGALAWVSIGTFRFSPGLKQVIERRFPGNEILNQELLLGYDNKLRYSHPIRFSIYKKMIQMLRARCPRLNLYLCMEEPLMWKALKLKLPF